MAIIQFLTNAGLSLSRTLTLVMTALTPVEGDIVNVQFETHPLGPYTPTLVEQDWEMLAWVGLADRAQIVRDPDPVRNQVLQVTYPQGAVGPGEGGGQFEVSLQPEEELWLSYYVKFKPGFDFQLGGKLPGLTSGGSDYTGGNRPVNGDGWSARYMWRQDGDAVVYPYYVDMPGEWGELLPLQDFRFVPGEWHQIVQRIKLNTGNQANGILETWIDGELRLARSDIRFRLNGQGLIDSFYFSTFHGGNTQDWAPDRDSFALFDDFVISKRPLIPADTSN